MRGLVGILCCCVLLMSPDSAFARDNIEKTSLSDVVIDDIGLVAKFGDNIWQSMDANEAGNWLNSLPLSSKRPSVRQINKDILLSASPAPEKQLKENDFIKLRLELLNQAGEVASSLALINLMNKNKSIQDIDIIKNDALIASGKIDDACKKTSYYLNKYKSLYWRENLILCDIADENFTRAELQLGIMSDDKKASKTDFFYVANAIVSEQLIDFNRIKETTLIIKNLLAFAPLNQIKNLNVKDPFFTLSLANNLKDGDLNKLIWQEKALDYGVVSHNDLTLQIKENDFEPKDTQDPLYWASKHSNDIRARILLYKTAVNADIPTIKAKLIAETIKLYKLNGLNYAGFRLFYEQIKDIKSSDELSWFSRYAIQSALINRDYELAQKWLSVAQEHVDDDNQAFLSYALLWRQVKITKQSNRIFNTNSAIDRSDDALDKLGKTKEEVSLYNQNLLLLLDAIGVAISPKDWSYRNQYIAEPTMFLEANEEPSPLLLAKLNYAEASSDKLQAAIIASIIADKSPKILEGSLSSASFAIRALNKSGLNEYATMMASEIMSSVM